jgi:hypothetical protein
LNPPFIPSDATLIVEDGGLKLFGLLISKMHMIWAGVVGGRLKNDIRYSAGIIYNTFPLPHTNYDSLKPYAQKIIDVRGHHKDSTMADLYDPDTMPSDLKKAHLSLDRAVEKLYRKEPFQSDHERIECLLEMYGNMLKGIKS